MFSNGDTYIPSQSVKYGIVVDSIGEKLGLKTGDKIVAVDGKPTKKFTDAVLDIILGDEITVNRDGQEITFPITDEGKKDVFQTQGRNFMTYRTKVVIGEVSDSSAAKAAGILVGDEILSINGETASFWDELVPKIHANANQTIGLQVRRNGKVENLTATIAKDSVLGIRPSSADLFKTDEYSLGAAIPAGFTKTIDVLMNQIRQFKVIFNTKTEAYQTGKRSYWYCRDDARNMELEFLLVVYGNVFGLVSLLNVLPIPALDGGHVMFLLYEIITGRAPSEKALERGQIVGFVILMSLMAVIFGNDIWNIIKRFI